MAQPLCVILALCGIIFVAAEAGVLKPRQIGLPPGAIVMDLAIRRKTDDEHASPIASMKIEFDGEHKKLTLFDAADQISFPPEEVKTSDKDFVPEIGTRSFIGAGRICPIGYVKRAGVCFPN